MCSRFHMLPQPYIYRWSPPGSPWRRPRRPCLGIRWWCVEPFVCQLCSHILYLMFCSPCSADMHTFHEQCVFYWWMSIFCEVVFKQVAFDLYMRGSGIRLGRHISIPVSSFQRSTLQSFLCLSSTVWYRNHWNPSWFPRKSHQNSESSLFEFSWEMWLMFIFRWSIISISSVDNTNINISIRII